MANDLTKNPIFLDTFNVDVNLGNPIVTSIVLISAAAGDDAVFIDKDGVGVPNAHLAQNINGGSVDWTPTKPFHFRNGLIFDTSGSNGLGSGDFIFIYLE